VDGECIIQREHLVNMHGYANIFYLRIVSRVLAEMEMLQVGSPEAPSHHFAEPVFNLLSEIWSRSRRTRYADRPSGGHVLAYRESACEMVQVQSSSLRGIRFQLSGDIIFSQKIGLPVDLSASWPTVHWSAHLCAIAANSSSHTCNQSQ